MKRNNTKGVIHKISTIIGILLCVVLIPILVINLTIVIKSYVYPDRVPDFFGLKLFIVETDSMKPLSCFQAGKVDELSPLLFFPR